MQCLAPLIAFEGTAENSTVLAFDSYCCTTGILKLRAAGSWCLGAATPDNPKLKSSNSNLKLKPGTERPRASKTLQSENANARNPKPDLQAFTLSRRSRARSPCENKNYVRDSQK